MELMELLNAPDREFTPVPFWFLNGDLRDEEIRRQLKDFADHGVYGVVLHPRIGLPRRIQYLSSAFFHYIRTAVRAAAELDMKVVLYDEGMYPSGSACGQVVEGHPELASEGITITETLLPGDELLAETDGGRLVARKSGGTLRGLHWGEDDGEPNVPASADILNPEAVNRFITLTHEAYYQRLKEYFGNTILGFFTDEPSILGRNTSGFFPWTRGFAADFVKAGGRLNQLAALFSGEENDSVRLYHAMILEREGRVYYGSLSKWCEQHGIALMGHPHQSDDIEVEQYFQIPGQDLVLRWLAPEKSGIAGMDSTMAKCSSDAARLMGRRRNANECFGACNKDENPWQLSGGDIKWYLDWLAVRGVNLFIPHAFYYSIAGKRKEERPPDVGPNSIWWPYYKQWSDYMHRLSCLMTDSELHADVAVLCRNRDLKPELTAPLYEGQMGFQYLPESVWKECQVENGSLVCRGRRYQAVLGDDKLLFSEVPHRLDGVTPDCLCQPAQPGLRCARFFRAGADCWLLVNEGENAIEAKLTLPVAGFVGAYDLWTGKAWKAEWFGEGETSFCTSLSLPRRGSLLFFTCAKEEYDSLDEQEQAEILPVPAFYCTGEDHEKTEKYYTAELTEAGCPSHGNRRILELDAEEMARLEVNGQPAGVSFWPPHRFDIGGLLREGRNELKLTVTGSPANRYGRPVWYGLRQG